MTPFQRAYIPQIEIDLVSKAITEEWNEDEALYRSRWQVPPEKTLLDHLKDVERLTREDTVFINDIYQVAMRPMEPSEGVKWPPMVHLSIKRRDRQPIHDWRHLQRIKDELVGPECEGVELYPAESRVVDTANQYHLWVLTQAGTRFPFGFPHGVKTEHARDKSVQRPFEKDLR